MRTILQELYAGNICPNEYITPKNPEYKIKSDAAMTMLHKWADKLPKEEYAELEKIIELRSEAEYVHQYDNFVYGLKLGALLMVEIFTGKGELVREEE